MGESASVEVLSAEARVLQVGNGQITRSMYRQLDEATSERFEPFGRVRDNERNLREGVVQLAGRDTTTDNLVRYDAYPPDWSPRKGPSEFAHWVLHNGRLGPYHEPYPIAKGPDGRHVFWSWPVDADCPGPSGWHVSKDRPDLPAWMGRARSSYPQRPEEKRKRGSGRCCGGS